MNLIVLTVIFSSCVVSSYNILALFPHRGKSHFDIFGVMLKKLAERGHHLTVLSYFPQKTPIRNYKDFVLNSSDILLHVSEINPNNLNRFTQYKNIITFMTRGIEDCESDLFSATAKQLYNSDQKFDVIIAEFFANTCFLGFVHRFKAPLIAISSTNIHPWDNEIIGNPSNPSYIPNFNLLFTKTNTFLDRVENTLLEVYQKLVICLYRDRENNNLAIKMFGNDLPNLKKIEYNVSVFLTNSHFSLHGSRPLVPGLIEVAGMHIEDAKPLPQDIEKWITESPHGVIYFSLGSMIKGHTFPEEKRQMFLNAFARLPQRVLWKWETEMPGQPKNVMINKWMPQFDILNHPNVKAFISHGGLLGTTESVHCGVPMLVMPQFGDQFANARAVEASGGGIMLDFTSLSEDLIYNSLKTVLHPDFNKKAKELSERFRDRPLPPLDTAVYWVEYVARHKGAPHMRTAAVGMPFYQYLLLDVIAFLTVILFVLFYIFYFVTKALFRKLFKSKSVPEKVKKQ